MKNPETLRGSVKLLRDGWATGLQPEVIDQIIGVLDRDGIRVNDVFCLGTPVPERFGASASVDPKVLGGVVEELLTVRDARLRHVRLFPKGIPWPELLDLEIEFGR